MSWGCCFSTFCIVGVMCINSLYGGFFMVMIAHCVLSHNVYQYKTNIFYSFIPQVWTWGRLMCNLLLCVWFSLYLKIRRTKKTVRLRCARVKQQKTIAVSQFRGWVLCNAHRLILLMCCTKGCRILWTPHMTDKYSPQNLGSIRVFFTADDIPGFIASSVFEEKRWNLTSV